MTLRLKLLLLQPPIQDYYDTDIRLQPIGLAYLKSAVTRELPEVEVLLKDYHHGWGRRTLPIPRELDYLKEYYTYPDQSPFSTFHNYFHFGADFETLAEDVGAWKPDLIGISSLFSPYYREALKCAEVLKKKLEVPIIMGGSHVSAMPEEMLASPFVDFVVRGEGEKPLVEFLKSFLSERNWEKVPSLGYKQNGHMILNPLLESEEPENLPEPDFSDFDPQDYLFEGKPLSFIVTSRSCPHRCSFCSVHKTFGFRYRKRSVESILNEIQNRYRQGIRVFDFEDDNLTYYKTEMRELCRRLIQAFPEKDAEFVAMNGISYLSLDDELLALMKEAGFTHLNLALVSSDLTVRQTTKRPHTIEKYIQVVRRASELGFKIVSYQILGLPNETLDSMIQTLVFNTSQPVLLGASLFYLTPNSPIAQHFPPPSESDVFKSRLTAMAVETEHFSRDDLYTLFIATRVLNFLKGLPVEGEKSMEEVLEQAFRIDRRTALGAQVLGHYFKTGEFCAATRFGLRRLERFKSEIFAQVWSKIEYVRSRSGEGRVRVYSRSLRTTSV